MADTVVCGILASTEKHVSISINEMIADKVL